MSFVTFENNLKDVSRRIFPTLPPPQDRVFHKAQPKSQYISTRIKKEHSLRQSQNIAKTEPDFLELRTLFGGLGAALIAKHGNMKQETIRSLIVFCRGNEAIKALSSNALRKKIQEFFERT